jgi:hypothetical protein
MNPAGFAHHKPLAAILKYYDFSANALYFTNPKNAKEI